MKKKKEFMNLKKKIKIGSRETSSKWKEKIEVF